MINLENITECQLPDVVFEKDGLWYFCDECQTSHGPYVSEKEAWAALDIYCDDFFGKDEVYDKYQTN